MTIRFPKVHIDNKQLVYVSFSIEGKRIRLYNGKRINSPIDPNRHPIEQRFEMGKILASDVYKHQEKTHLLRWALRMCSVAVRLAPHIVQSCSITSFFDHFRSF